VNAPYYGDMLSPRQVAFDVLLRVESGAYASDLLRAQAAPLASRDAALAGTLVFGCLRYQAQLDFLIGHFSGRPQAKLDPEVRIALRMGIYQLRYLDRIPPHAGVGESVELVKRAGKRSAGGFVNAVLRKVNREPVDWPSLAIELSMPAWMLERWIAHYGRQTAIGIARAALAEPESAVNPTTGRQQDVAAQSIVPLLDVKPGMRVLDLCAAPGNKTAQILSLLDSSRVTACDRYHRRLLEVPDEAARVVCDASQPLPFAAKFDRILVDAPCSGTGTLGRNPEIKWRLRLEDLTRFQALQRQILSTALAVLSPGGTLVYSTCSLEPEENEKLVDGLPGLASTAVRIPGRDPGDGFFAAVIKS
jgi:16S rRNA (cytosine967-C5)-methyltransferase